MRLFTAALPTAVLLFGTPSKAQELPPFKIVHLGDSYSAGNSARTNEGEEAFYSVEGCFRSWENWGSLFSRSLTDLFSVTYINRACSGGVLADITAERKLDMVDKPCPASTYPDEEFFREGSETCTRFLKPQIEAVDKSVDLVLMTIIGNDCGFDNIIKQCFALGYRDEEECLSAIDFANNRTDTIGKDLTKTFAEIRKKLKPEARVVLVSYPHVLLNVMYILDEIDLGARIRELSERGEEVQRMAVNAANEAAGESYTVFFEMTKALFDGHEPDPSVLSENNDRWINEFFEGALPEWYHMNRLGHVNLGNALSILETFGAVGGTFMMGANIDLAFIIDTTGSMGDEINTVRTNLASLVD